MSNRSDFQVKICDFGLAQHLDNPADPASTLVLPDEEGDFYRKTAPRISSRVKLPFALNIWHVRGLPHSDPELLDFLRFFWLWTILAGTVFCAHPGSEIPHMAASGSTVPHNPIRMIQALAVAIGSACWFAPKSSFRVSGVKSQS